jgi:hypothetical protein
MTFRTSGLKKCRLFISENKYSIVLDKMKIRIHNNSNKAFQKISQSENFLSLSEIMTLFKTCLSLIIEKMGFICVNPANQLKNVRRELTAVSVNYFQSENISESERYSEKDLIFNNRKNERIPNEFNY